MSEKLWENSELSSEVVAISSFLLGKCVYVFPLVFILVNVLYQINLLPESISQLVLLSLELTNDLTLTQFISWAPVGCCQPLAQKKKWVFCNILFPVPLHRSAWLRDWFCVLVLVPWVWEATLTLSSSFHIFGLNRLHSVISSCFFISNGNLLTPQVIGWWTSAFRSRNSSTSGE